MRIRLDNILLCTLWVLAVTLGTSFWFNTVFGFNVFSASHWEYAASLQATNAPVKVSFYVSIAITIFIAIFGIYLILRPRIRKIRMPIMKIKKTTTNTAPIQNNLPQKNEDASTLDILPAEVQPSKTQNTSTPSYVGVRPPRLVVPSLNNTFMPTQSPAPTLQGPKKEPDNNDIYLTELRTIFSNAGYTVKPNTMVNGIKTSLIAIGTNETMWLGCIGVKTTQVREIIEKFQRVFADTLDETEISINGFALFAPDAGISEFQDILMFNSIDELRKYMEDIKNPPIPDDDDGMFEAYSQYIDAVITHIGKI